ncbi:MAG: ATP synthase F1 subunit gamma [Candidatus Omnitrophica bacterium CG11_big_fil_rev_8_21_14_0_20_42_13]|uniref:ATP synthase gamma chain n=1 Tax=Candidatus Ghiorseimicrobium undicola TaxID=1974746 RepID=A0A2H0LYG8_9BACT|nr:MAG: ATP synthase F1 subunit gamma [Candidatus Omnitrophica bacterium CG11_big_fil_rev_8_21_14_0_20_42_13]
MADIRGIKLRTEGIKKILKVTSAMQIVAATKLKRAEERALKSRFYVKALGEILAKISIQDGFLKEKAFSESASESGLCLLAVCSERGLCGGFNAGIFKKVEEHAAAPGLKILPVGKKGFIHFKRKKLNLISDIKPEKDEPLDSFTGRIASFLLKEFYKGSIRKISIVYNMFRQHSLGTVVAKQVLPIIQDLLSGRAEEEKNKNTYKALYLYEPDIEILSKHILEEYLESFISGAILESRASEEMARMLAMKYATDNGNELLSALTLQYHKLRQANITREIIEVAGAGI